MFFNRILKECLITVKLINSNILATIVPGMAFTLSSLVKNESSYYLLAKSFVYFFLYVIIFDYSNQIVGVEEDKKNKPTRPIASGLISVKGAWKRFYIYSLLWIIFSAELRIWAILWIATSILNNFYKSDRYWWGKDLTISIGIIVQLAPAWIIGGALSQEIINLILFLALTNFWLVNIQDLRDVPGDYLIKRETFPIMFGSSITRKIFAVSFLGMIPITFFVLFNKLNISFFGNAMLLISVSIILFLGETKKSDNIAYTTYLLWYVYILLSPIL